MIKDDKINMIEVNHNVQSVLQNIVRLFNFTALI